MSLILQISYHQSEAVLNAQHAYEAVTDNTMEYTTVSKTPEMSGVPMNKDAYHVENH